MITRVSKSPFTFVLYSAVAVTLIGTPMWNKDALIIPKVTLLFLSAIFLIPYLISDYKSLMKEKILKILIIVLTLISIHYVIVLITSESPIEQQIFGRSGRGIGLITLVSLVCITVASAKYAQVNKIEKLNNSLALTGVVSGIYGILQSYGIDPLAWDAKNNGVIGTLGNPNFQSSLLAMSLVPVFVYSIKLKNKSILTPISVSFILFAIYRAQSTQGYVGAALASSIFAVIYLWKKKRLLAVTTMIMLGVTGIVAIAGMLNKGPLSEYLYKISIQSRGDFWRAAINIIKDHPLSGVGLDSFGDYFLKYRDLTAVNHTFAEYADNAHNYFLDYAVTGGYPLLVLNLTLIALTLYSFNKILKLEKSFNIGIASIFCAFIVFQAQSFISPNNISLMLWNAIIIGSIIGISRFQKVDPAPFKLNKNFSILNPFSIAGVIAGILFIFPYFNSDKLQLEAMQNGDGDLAIKSAKMYPESVVRYSTLSRELFKSGLKVQSLDLARAGVAFNPNSASLWALILINPAAPLNERIVAQKEILRLDPLNSEVKNYFIEP